MMGARQCLHCGIADRWNGGLWCRGCIYVACCSTYPRVVHGRLLPCCQHADA